MPLRMCYNKEMEETALLSAQDSFTVKHSEQPAGTAMLGQNSVSSKLHLTPASGFLSLLLLRSFPIMLNLFTMEKTSSAVP